MTAILKIRDQESGNFVGIPAIKGEPGDNGLNGSDGNNGIDGKSIEFIFKSQESEIAPEKPTSLNIDDYVPKGWTDDQQGVSGSCQYEFVCKRVKYKELWGDFSVPSLWARYSYDGEDGKDGKDIEFIFTRTTVSVNPDTPSTSQTDDYIPVGWTDNALGVNSENKYEWTSKRSKVNGAWGNFSSPALWSKYAFDGADGNNGEDGKGIEFIFCRQSSAIAPSKPTSVDIDDHIPNGWTDDQQGVTGLMQYEFACKRVKSEGSWGEYSSPALWARYSFDGENGKDGTDNEFIFSRTKSSYAPSTPSTSYEDDYVPQGWTDNAIGVTSVYQYEWTSKRRKVNGVWGNFSTPALWAKYSFDGADGHPGADGTNGLPGEKGADGQQFYTWIRYSDSADGTGMDNNPDRAYIGIAVNQLNPIEGNDKTVYKWSKTKGADGIPGEKGEDGKQLYTWMMYADTSTGEGISNDATGKLYIGFAYNKDTAIESINPLDYKWSLIRGTDGKDFDDEAYRYLKEALKNGKTQDGVGDINGIVLSNILGVTPPKDGAYELRDIRAGMSGISDDKVAFFANPTNAYAVAKDYFNGISQTRPKFAVNDEGTVVADDIDIGGGSIGGFKISSGRIEADYVNNPEIKEMGFSLTSDSIVFSDKKSRAAIGNNVYSSMIGLKGLALFEIGAPTEDSGYFFHEGVALTARTSFPDDGLDPILVRRSFSNHGNMFSIGSHCFFDKSYIGEAFSNTLELRIGLTHQYVFTTLNHSLLIMNLPTVSQIKKVIGTDAVSFLLQLQVGNTGHTGIIRVKGQSGAMLFDNSGNIPNWSNDNGYLDISKGDSLILRYYSGTYCMVQYRT